MRASAVRVIPPAWATSDFWVRPEKREWLESLGLRTPCDYLSLPGVVVSGHVGRNVSRVDLGGTTTYLKREHRVRLRDRFRAWGDGFGRASVSAREAAVLRRLEEHGLPGPRCLAFGEDDGQGFLLLSAADEHIEFRCLTTFDDDLAGRLGRVIARVHAAGIDQPDLFAKHVLVHTQSGTFTILDWQRAVLRRGVSWPNRARALAALRASAPPALFPEAVWDRVLAGYRVEADRTEQDAPDVPRLRAMVAAFTDRLARRPGIRNQESSPAVPVRQELVRIGGETVCAIPEVAADLADESAVANLYDPADDGRRLTLAGGRVGHLRSRRYRLPFGRWWAAVRGRAWRSPELKAARLLFHLERHVIPAPKLLAYGQTVPLVAPAASFLLSEVVRTEPVGAEHAAAAHELLNRLHAAGCGLNDVGDLPLAVSEGRVLVANPYGVRLVKRLTRRQAARDRARVDAFVRGLR